MRITIELYHWEPTVNSGELLICLREKDVGFVSHYVDLLALEQHSPEFLALNPRGEVPVLVHDGQVLTETTLVLEYLDAVFTNVPLVPERPAERYCMRVWTKLANDYFAPALTLLGWHERMAQKMTTLDRAAITARLSHLPQDRAAVWRTALDDSYSADHLARANQHLDVVAHRMEDALAAGDWLAGTSYSLADIAMYPAASALQALRPQALNRPALPKLVDWLGRMRERPAVLAALGTSRSARPEEAFAPGPELGRWG
jgi:glutathione S-transferase/GST-like protein